MNAAAEIPLRGGMHYMMEMYTKAFVMPRTPGSGERRENMGPSRVVVSFPFITITFHVPSGTKGNQP